MREMVLNQASLNGSRQQAIRWVGEMARGMAALVDAGIVEQSLRTVAAPAELRSPQGWSVLEACLGLSQVGKRDEGLFLLRLTSKAPLLSGVAETIKSRFLACEARDCESRELSTTAGEPLVLCAVGDGVAISFPSEPVWDRDSLTVRFHELLPNGDLFEAEEDVDNLARSGHAEPILRRYRRTLSRRCSNGVELWLHQGELYPHLIFGPDVQRHVERMDASFLSVVMNRLAQLNEAAGQWEAGPAPSWPCKVTPESDTTMANRRLRQARTFRSTTGTREAFEWHARFGNGGRIHLRFDAKERVVEIGYIGMHLPL